MGARRTDMHRLQEMLRLHRLGQGSRTIARRLRMGRDTIRAYLAAFGRAGLLEGPADELPELTALRALVREAAVIRASFGVDGPVELNRTYRELARHHGFQVDPTPPRSPQNKGSGPSATAAT
jgi:hypothetical protein